MLQCMFVGQAAQLRCARWLAKLSSWNMFDCPLREMSLSFYCSVCVWIVLHFVRMNGSTKSKLRSKARCLTTSDETAATVTIGHVFLIERKFIFGRAAAHTLRISPPTATHHTAPLVYLHNINIVDVVFSPRTKMSFFFSFFPHFPSRTSSSSSHSFLFHWPPLALRTLLVDDDYLWQVKENYFTFSIWTCSCEVVLEALLRSHGKY